MQHEPPINDATIPHRVELNLREVGQVFNTMDHSPFQERDLDHDAEEFILSWVREFPVNGPVVLVVHLSEFPPGQEPQPLVEGAVHNYFAYRARLNRLEFGRLMKEGRQNLAIGLLFLLACLAVSNALIGRCYRHLPEFDAGEPHHCGLGGHVAADADLLVRLVAPPSAGTGLREAEPDGRGGPQTKDIAEGEPY
jgi:hypothetical protein